MTVELEGWQLAVFLVAWFCSYWKQRRTLKHLQVLVALSAVTFSLKTGTPIKDAREALKEALD